MSLITLTEGDDTYVSSTAGDIVQGLGGNDKITASDGGNILWGGDGNDTLNGGAGDDTIYGDNATNTAYHNTLKGGGGADHIVSFSWYDTINGGTGDDYVESFAMTTGQAVDGGTGVDKISIRSLSAQAENIHLVLGTTFSPTVGATQGATYANFEVLEFYGGTGSNTIEGGAYADTIVNTFTNVSNFAAGSLKGWGGDDHMEFNAFPTSGTGIETIDGGADNDTLFWTNGFGSFSNLNINASTGNMKEAGATFATFVHIENLNITTSNGSTGAVSITGGAGVETLFVNGSTSNIHGNGGNDFITINSGVGTVDAGDGDDHVVVTFANANSCTIHGGIGDDSLGGGQGQNQVFGEEGNDSLGAQNGRTSLYGGSGDDSLSNTSSYSMSGSGAATLDGGGGKDFLLIERSLGGTTFTLDFSAAGPFVLPDGTTIKNVEGIDFVAGSGNDVMISSNDPRGALFNKLYGVGGDDRLTASSNGATLDGGGGAANILIAGASADRFAGGTVSYARSNQGVTIDQTLATGQVSAGFANGDILSTATYFSGAIAGVTGSGHNDSLAGNAIANILNGGGGDDTLTGRGGKDTLTGGAGKDTFVFAAADSTGSGFDSVTDFDAKADLFKVGAAVTGMNNTIGSGALHSATFDADMNTAIGNHLKADHAILFTPNAGDDAGKVFLVVDQNGAVGYQTGFDLVIEVTGIVHQSSLSGSDFTT